MSKSSPGAAADQEARRSMKDAHLPTLAELEADTSAGGSAVG
jgi:hypothetical protein